MKTHLVLHHSLTPDGDAFSSQAIRRYHTQTLGWDDVGYHFLVERVRDRFEMIAGRPILSRAAAAYQQGMNRAGVHVCFVGNFDAMPPPEELLTFAAPHLADICEALRIPLDKDHVIGHRQVADYKTCPGKLFNVNTMIGLMRGA